MTAERDRLEVGKGADHIAQGRVIVDLGRNTAVIDEARLGNQATERRPVRKSVHVVIAERVHRAAPIDHACRDRTRGAVCRGYVTGRYPDRDRWTELPRRGHGGGGGGQNTQGEGAGRPAPPPPHTYGPEVAPHWPHAAAPAPGRR